MIVECPECATRFSLPADRVTSRGSKVRCSKCNATFRVRLSASGVAEVVDKQDLPSDPPTQDLSDLFEDSLFGDDANPGATQIGMAARDRRDQPEKGISGTFIGRPSPQQEASKSAATSFNPFPHVGEKDDGAGIDLFDGEEPSIAGLSSASHADMDVFSEVFGDDDKPAPDSGILQPASPKRAPKTAPVEQPKPAPAIVKKPLMSALPTDIPLMDDAPVSAMSDFGSADQLVDPSFGEDAAYFDPSAGVVETPAAPKPAPRPGPPGRQTGPVPPTRPAPAAAPAPARAPVAASTGDFDVAPHRIGGGGAQKVVNMVLIGLLAVAAVLGFIAYRTGGVLDFGQFDNMMEILVEGKPYTPRKEWIPEAPPAPAAPEKPALSTQNVFARLVSVGKRDAVLVVTGDVLNDSDDPKEAVDVRVMLLDESAKVLSETAVQTGRVLEIEDIAAAKTSADVKALSPTSARSIRPKSTTPFMAVFSDPPAKVRENKSFNVRVELPE